MFAKGISNLFSVTTPFPPLDLKYWLKYAKYIFIYTLQLKCHTFIGLNDVAPKCYIYFYVWLVRICIWQYGLTLSTCIDISHYFNLKPHAVSFPFLLKSDSQLHIFVIV